MKSKLLNIKMSWFRKIKHLRRSLHIFISSDSRNITRLKISLVLVIFIGNTILAIEGFYSADKKDKADKKYKEFVKSSQEAYGNFDQKDKKRRRARLKDRLIKEHVKSQQRFLREQEKTRKDGEPD